MKYTYILLVIFILIIIYLHEYYTELKKPIKYIFWTGGYDSTFLICKYLIVDKYYVQPIYITQEIDNCKDCKFKRKNKSVELNTQKKIIQKIKKKFPKESKRLKPTIYVYNIPKSEYITQQVIDSGIFRRRYHQYEAMCRYSKFIKKRIETGVHVGYFDTYLNKHSTNGMINNIKNPFYYIGFPIYKVTKKDMKQYAIKYNFLDILYITWSCWFPKSNKPCGKCPMCRERILK